MSDALNLAASDTLGDAIRDLVRLLDPQRDEGSLSPGELAELRRADPANGTLPPVMWRMLTTSRLIALPLRPIERYERALAILISAMAQPGVLGSAPLPVGVALAEGKYAEQRLIRLLRARGLTDVAHEARLAAQWCANQGKHLLFLSRGRDDGFGPFIVDAALDHAAAGNRAHAIARDYFRQSAREEQRDIATSEPAQ
jgi:hypothetical protein